MSQAYSLKQYFHLFDSDAQKLKIKTIYINSEDEQVFNEFIQINKEKNNYYKLLNVNVTRSQTYMTIISMSKEQRGELVLQFFN